MIIAFSAGRDSPFELRERIALDQEGERTLLRSRRPGIGELVVLSTCHRTEVYATAEGSEADAVHELAGLFPTLQAGDQAELRFLRGSTAVEHLFRVACGLDSLVLGEPQILGQVRRAYTLSREIGSAGPVLSNIFSRAIRIARRARVETALGRQRVSIGLLTAQHLAERLDGLNERAGAIVGAGEAASDAAGALAEAGARLSIVGRAPASAQLLAAHVGGRAFPLGEMADVLDTAEFAVVAVSGGALVHTEHVRDRNGRTSLQVLDLSVPRAVDIVGRADVDVHSIEDLTAPETPELAAAVVDVEQMVRQAIDELDRWTSGRASGRAVGDLRAYAGSVARLEAARTLAGMTLDQHEQERVAGLAMRIANKLMHGPSVAMRDGDDQTRALIRAIFNLEP